MAADSLIIYKAKDVNKRDTTFGSRPFTPEETAKINQMLSQKMLRGELSTRAGPGNTRLTYVTSNKAIELANSIFTFNGWSSEITDLRIDFATEDRSGKWSVGIQAIMRITLQDGTFHEDVGYGAAMMPDRAGAIDKAKKEACSDGLKRALRLFGNKLGNCIYDKEFLKQLASASARGEEQKPVEPAASANASASAAPPSSSSSAAAALPSASRPVLTPPQPARSPSVILVAQPAAGLRSPPANGSGPPPLIANGQAVSTVRTLSPQKPPIGPTGPGQGAPLHPSSGVAPPPLAGAAGPAAMSYASSAPNGKPSFSGHVGNGHQLSTPPTLAQSAIGSSNSFSPQGQSANANSLASPPAPQPPRNLLTLPVNSHASSSSAGALPLSGHGPASVPPGMGAQNGSSAHTSSMQGGPLHRPIQQLPVPQFHQQQQLSPPQAISSPAPLHQLPSSSPQSAPAGPPGNPSFSSSSHPQYKAPPESHPRPQSLPWPSPQSGANPTTGLKRPVAQPGLSDNTEGSGLQGSGGQHMDKRMRS